MLDRIWQWATEQVGLPRSDFGKAVRYVPEPLDQFRLRRSFFTQAVEQPSGCGLLPIARAEVTAVHAITELAVPRTR